MLYRYIMIDFCLKCLILYWMLDDDVRWLCILCACIFVYVISVWLKWNWAILCLEILSFLDVNLLEIYLNSMCMYNLNCIQFEAVDPFCVIFWAFHIYPLVYICVCMSLKIIHSCKYADRYHVITLTSIGIRNQWHFTRF